MNFFGAFSGLPLRPLLLAAGAAAATASIYTYVKRSEDTTAEPEDTTEGPDTEVVKDQMMKLLVSKIQLQDRVKELEELLCEAHRDCDLKSKVTLAEAEEKHQKIISQLEEEMFDLTEKVETLRDTVKILMKKLIKTDRECDERINVTLAEAEEKHQKDVETIHQLEKEKDEMKKTITQLEEEKDQMKKTLNNKEEFLKVTLAEAEEKHQKIISQLEEEMFDLTEKVTLAEAEEKHQKDVETIHQLEKEKDEMKKTLNNKEEFLKVTLAQAVDDVETIAQLEKENADLRIEVETLRDTVKILGKKLFECNRV
ncbi:hypothetical protein KOW79_006872 [Hemibagrus wyckioides]|uniref:Uncharacterized protein n=1 Tax=Hemibagrus wyckioides TaxID=337641 RepID=A0A9D3SPE2_9TELE|nr:hypothetical protein KOW79_006872 [Hemibagrus wyckioides]